jgi:hypothetical protein
MPTHPSKNSLSRVLDVIFGARLQGEDAERARAERPPRSVRAAYDILHLGSFLSVVVLFLWSHGWLPFVESQGESIWFWYAFGLNVLLRFGWDQLTAYYRRRANRLQATSSQ